MSILNRVVRALTGSGKLGNQQPREDMERSEPERVVLPIDFYKGGDVYGLCRLNNGWVMYDYKLGDYDPPLRVRLNGEEYKRFSMIVSPNPGVGWVWYYRG